MFLLVGDPPGRALRFEGNLCVFGTPRAKINTWQLTIVVDNVCAPPTLFTLSPSLVFLRLQILLNALGKIRRVTNDL